jgi:hypothetical protein
MGERVSDFAQVRPATGFSGFHRHTMSFRQGGVIFLILPGTVVGGDGFEPPTLSV